MRRDRSKDEELFDCKQRQHLDDVICLYPANSLTVTVFLTNKCRSHQLFYSTFGEIYSVIERELGLSIPD